MLVGMQTGTVTLENSMEFPPNLKVELPYDPAVALVGIYSMDTKILIRMNTCLPMLTAKLSACPVAQCSCVLSQVHDFVSKLQTSGSWCGTELC